MNRKFKNMLTDIEKNRITDDDLIQEIVKPFEETVQKIKDGRPIIPHEFQAMAQSSESSSPVWRFKYYRKSIYQCDKMILPNFS